MAYSHSSAANSDQRGRRGGRRVRSGPSAFDVSPSAKARPAEPSGSHDVIRSSPCLLFGAADADQVSGAPVRTISSPAGARSGAWTGPGSRAHAMTVQQGLAFAIVGAMMLLFVWGRLRYDVVAMLALFAAVASGIVPAKDAFTGFSDDVVIIVATALLVSAAVAKSGITEQIMRPLVPYLTSTRSQVFTLVLAVIVLSTFIKNVGALAIMMPVAFQFAKRSK